MGYHICPLGGFSEPRQGVEFLFIFSYYNNTSYTLSYIFKSSYNWPVHKIGNILNAGMRVTGG